MRCGHYGKRVEIEHCYERKAECLSKGKSVLTHTGELSLPVSAADSYSIIVLSSHFLFTGKNVFDYTTCVNIYESCTNRHIR